MSTRRERAKSQNRQAENQLATAVVKPKEKNEFLFELGKYSYDLSKLTFGGVVLVNAFHLSEDNTTDLIAGALVMAGLLVLGMILIKRGLHKR